MVGAGRARRGVRTGAVLGVGLAVVLLASTASAETIRLKSGKVLDVQSVRVLDGRLNVTVRNDGQSARVALRFDQLEPRALLTLLDRYADPQDPAAQVRNARLALDYGLREEAAVRELADHRCNTIGTLPHNPNRMT